MNKRIEDAINLRIGLINYIRAAKKIDNTILGFELKHYFSGKIDEFAMWKEWQELADTFVIVKDTIPNCEKEIKMPILVRETRDKLKLLFKRTIVEALAEIIVCDINVDGLHISNGGICLLCSSNFGYRSEYLERYCIPKELSNILNANNDYSIIDSNLIGDVMEEFKRENIGYSDYLGYKFGEKPIIVIRIEKE